MKTIFILVSFCVLLGYVAFRNKNTSPAGNMHATDFIDFKKEVQPILIKRCSPCHFPGGKMYERLPFDTSITILQKKDGILRRIKDEPDNSIIRKFVEENRTEKENRK
jgi:hypothetical protein